MSRWKQLLTSKSPGFYPDLDEDLYRADPAISQSDLKRFAENPRAFMLDRENPEAQDNDTAAKRQGRLFHLATLQPDIFNSGYARLPVGWNLDERHQRIIDWRSRHPGQEPVRAVEWVKAVTMASSIRKHEGLCKIIERGQKELSLFWVEPETGTPCKGRVDCYDEETATILDLKGVDVGTTLDQFLIACYKWRYFVQAAFYTDGIKQLGKPVDHFIFLAYERSTYKPDFLPVKLGPFSEEMGRQGYIHDLERLKALNGHVPNLPDDVQVAELPSWALAREHQQINQ